MHMSHHKALHTAILMAMLLMLGACRGSSDMAQLRTVEATIDAQPEEAWYMLDSIDPTPLRGEARALYALLATQADYQCYVPLTSDSLIRIATHYYGSDKRSHRAALAHYYLGCTYTELGHDAAAIQAYMQALTLFPDTTVRHHALCYQNMARHYRNRNMYAECLSAFRAFRSAMVQRGSALDVYNADYQIAVTYLYMECFDEATPRLRALLADPQVPQRIVDEATFQLAKIACYHTEDYAEAMTYIDRHIASVSDPRRLGPDHSVKGDIYLALGHTDSARHYYTLSLQPGRDVYADCNTYYKLISLSLSEGQTDSVASYVAHHTLLLDSIAHMQSRAEIERVHADHQLQLHDRALRLRHVRFVLIATTGIVILALVLLVTFVAIDNRRKARYIHLQQQLAQNRVEMLALTSMPDDADVPPVAPDHERLLALRRQRIDYCIEVFAHTPWQSRISHIEHNATDELTLPDRMALHQALTDSFADVLIDLKSVCPALTATDLQLITLTLLGCSIRTAAICTALSENALRTRKTRLKGKMSEELYKMVFEQTA